MTDDPLEAWLKPRPPSDDGFTDTVLARLPEKRRAVRRTPVLAGAAGLGVVVTALFASKPLTSMFEQVMYGKLSLGALPMALVLAAIVGCLVASTLQLAPQD